MENQERDQGVEIDLKRLALFLWSRMWLILLVAVIFAVAAFSYAYLFITPTYSASVQLYVNNNYMDSPGFTSTQLSAAQDLAETYMVIMKSRPVLEGVREKTGLNYTDGQLRGMIQAAAVNETEVFRVTVVSTDYRHATLIANAIADVLPDRISAVVEGSSVRLVEGAIENPNPIGPSYKRYALIGALAGALLTVSILAVANLLDTRIVSEEYLTKVYGDYPLLAVIPGTEESKSNSYKGYYETAQPSKPAPTKKQPPQQKGGAEQ